MMYQILAPHMVAAIEFSIPYEGEPDDWYVSNAPPILRYMMGWSPEAVETACKRRGWTFTRLYHTEGDDDE